MRGACAATSYWRLQLSHPLQLIQLFAVTDGLIDVGSYAGELLDTGHLSQGLAVILQVIAGAADPLPELEHEQLGR